MTDWEGSSDAANNLHYSEGQRRHVTIAVPKRDSEPPQKRNGLPPEILEIIWPALQVGGLSGMSLSSIRYIELYEDSSLSSNWFELFARDSILYETAANLQYKAYLEC